MLTYLLTYSLYICTGYSCLTLTLIQRVSKWTEEWTQEWWHSDNIHVCHFHFLPCNADDTQSRNLYTNLPHSTCKKTCMSVAVSCTGFFLYKFLASNTMQLYCVQETGIHVTKTERCAGVNKVAVIVAWGVLLTVKSVCCKHKILWIYMFIGISMPTHSLLAVVILTSKWMLSLWCHLGNKFWEFQFWKFLVQQSCIKICCKFFPETCTRLNHVQVVDCAPAVCSGPVLYPGTY